MSVVVVVVVIVIVIIAVTVIVTVVIFVVVAVNVVVVVTPIDHFVTIFSKLNLKTLLMKTRGRGRGQGDGWEEMGEQGTIVNWCNDGWATGENGGEIQVNFQFLRFFLTGFI